MPESPATSPGVSAVRELTDDSFAAVFGTHRGPDGRQLLAHAPVRLSEPLDDCEFSPVLISEHYERNDRPLRVAFAVGVLCEAAGTRWFAAVRWSNWAQRGKWVTRTELLHANSRLDPCLNAAEVARRAASAEPNMFCSDPEPYPQLTVDGYRAAAARATANRAA